MGNPVRISIGLVSFALGCVFWIGSLGTSAYTSWDLDRFHPEGAEISQSFGWVCVLFSSLSLAMFSVRNLRNRLFHYFMAALSVVLLVTVLARIIWVYSIAH